MARVKLKIGENEIEIDSRDFYIDNHTMGEIIDKILHHLPETKAQLIHDNNFDLETSQSTGLDILDDAEVFEPEFSKPKAIKFSEIESKLRILETSGFFKYPHTVGEVVQQLGEYGWVVSMLDVSKVLYNMASKKEISRILENNRFYYSIQDKPILI